MKKKVKRLDGKRPVTFRMNTELFQELTDFCDKQGFAKGRFVERGVRELLEKLKEGIK